jgi:hypothetical protein
MSIVSKNRGTRLEIRRRSSMSTNNTICTLMEIAGEPENNSLSTT